MQFLYHNPENCPMTNIMTVLGGRWKFIIVYTLVPGPRRFGQIRNMIPSISKKVLTEMLRELEADQIISRTELTDKVPVNVVYGLTERGEQLVPILKEMANWGMDYASEVGMRSR